MPECNGYITTVDETAQFAPGKRRSDPSFIITDVGIKDGLMYAELLGGWADGYPGWTLLDITTAQAVYGHGSATFCFEPDPDFEVSDTI